MSKYNFRIDRIDPTTAYGQVLMRIKPESTVLECGCATGYMTRYLKEQMKCTVDIVEVDYDAFKIAEQYARQGVFASLDGPAWFMPLHEKLYKYILFADVLEHLKDPMLVLTQAKDLLDAGGKIIVSIPNVCHNDVILNMIDGKFTYTKYGLLDDTHIHFWGRDDFEQMCQVAGLRVTDVGRVFMKTGTTEQRPDLRKNGQTALNVMKARPDGEVYQWIFVLER